MKTKYLIWLILSGFITSQTFSQQCPPNIGFETGTFDNWDCSAGFILRDGTLNLSPTSPIPNRHTIIPNSYPQDLDPYGGFPVNCPNGSGYSVRLGNSIAGGQAEGMSYTFNVPSNQNDYSILYNYAVVFQNPPHQPWEQPRFTSKIYNVTDNKYIECGSFQFVASSNLPGFILSTIGNNVFYKPWSPVTVNLSGLAGKTIRLEFTTNDCAFTQHFGYAYLDVNEDCSSEPIAGNTYCGGAQSIILTAPFGFATYSWYPADFSHLLGSENILTISPAPPANTTYAVVITPYDGLGCEDTLYTTIHISPEPFKLNVLDEITGCSTGVDLTSPAITAGSTPGLTYSYYTDLNQTNYVPVPSKVTTSGIYYIKGVNKAGCNDIKPIKVTVMEPPNLTITNPAGVCMPQKIDITDPAVTVSLPDPNAVTVSSTYHIMASSSSGCSIIRTVLVTVNPIPDFIVTDPAPVVYPVMTIDLTSAVNQNADLTYTYWLDSLTRKPVINPRAVDKRGRYFIRATNEFGCSLIKPVNAVIIPPPEPIVYAPTAFTPNNDGLNDVFRIKIIGEISVNHLKIYNRWGQVVFDDSNLNRHWNGKLKGIELPVGVYIWILDGFDTYFKKPFAQKGLITVSYTHLRA